MLHEEIDKTLTTLRESAAKSSAARACGLRRAAALLENCPESVEGLDTLVRDLDRERMNTSRSFPDTRTALADATDAVRSLLTYARDQEKAVEKPPDAYTTALGTLRIRYAERERSSRTVAEGEPYHTFVAHLDRLDGSERAVKDLLDSYQRILREKGWDVASIENNTLHDIIEDLEQLYATRLRGTAVENPTPAPTPAPDLSRFITGRLAVLLDGMARGLVHEAMPHGGIYGVIRNPKKFQHLLDNVNLIAQELLDRQSPLEEGPCDCALCLAMQSTHEECEEYDES